MAGTQSVDVGKRFCCDHCGTAAALGGDGAARDMGWALLTVNGEDRALCPPHYKELQVFLHLVPSQAP